MKLTKTINDLGKENYHAHLENPLGDNENTGFQFHLEYILPYDQMFQDKNKEQEVIEFYENSPLQLPIDTEKTPSFLKVGNKIYGNKKYMMFNNFDASINLNVHYWEHFDLQKYAEIAIKNLRSIVEKGGLNIGDKRIIKTIALQTFYGMVNSLVDGEFKGYGFNHCLQTNKNEFAIAQLHRYGFELKKDDKIVDFSLKG